MASYDYQLPTDAADAAAERDARDARDDEREEESQEARREDRERREWSRHNPMLRRSVEGAIRRQYVLRGKRENASRPARLAELARMAKAAARQLQEAAFRAAQLELFA